MIDSADRRSMEETGVELQQLLDEVRTYLLLTLIVIVRVTTKYKNSISSFVSRTLIVMVTSIRTFRVMFPPSVQNKLFEQYTVMCRIRGEWIVMMVLRGK